MGCDLQSRRDLLSRYFAESTAKHAIAYAVCTMSHAPVSHLVEENFRNEMMAVRNGGCDL